MKFLAVLAALIAVATATPVLVAGGQTTMNLEQLSHAIQDPATSPAVLPFLEAALNSLMDQIFAGHNAEAIAVTVPALDVTSWTLTELSAALQDPSTNAELMPYLEHALDEYMNALYSGMQLEAIQVVTPANLLPVVAPPLIVVTPEEAAAIPAPVIVAEEAAPAAASSPLVQIIVNIQQQGQVAEVPAPAPVAVAPVPEPVTVVETAPIPEPITVVETAPQPEPVTVVEQTPVVVEQPGNPIDVIAITAPETNPIDVVAITAPETNPIDVVAITAPEINPVDVISPVLINPAGAIDNLPIV